MKRFILLATITLILTTSCNRHLAPMKFSFQEVVEAPNISQDILYQRAIEWYNETFRDMRSVIQYQDKTTGTFYGKAYLDFPRIKGVPGNTFIYFTVNISVKNGKYKYELNNFYHEGSIPAHHKTNLTAGGNLENGRPEKTYPKMRLKVWGRIRNYSYNDIEATIKELKDKMTKQSLPESFK